jgi:hypothetical protein
MLRGQGIPSSRRSLGHHRGQDQRRSTPRANPEGSLRVFYLGRSGDPSQASVSLTFVKSRALHIPSRATIAYIGLIVMIATLLGIITFSALRLGMPERVPVNSFARPLMNIGTAISKLQYHTLGYGSSKEVLDILVRDGFNADSVNTPGALDRAISNARAINSVSGNSPLASNASEVDDQGYADYVMLAFDLFGFRISALFYIAILLLCTSTLIYAVGLHRQYIPLILLGCFLAAVAMTVRTLPNSTVASVIQDARFSAIWAGPSALHLGQSILWPPDRVPRQWLAIFCQATILVFAVMVRSTAFWLIIFLVITAAYTLLSERRMRFVTDSAIVLGLISSLLFLNSFKQRMTNPAGFSETGTGRHLIWHSLAMGLAFHPDAATVGFGTRDWEIYNLADRYLEENPGVATRLEIDRGKISHEATYADFSAVGWAKYDQVVGELLLKFVREHPGYVLDTIFWYRPLYFFAELGWQFGIVERFPGWIQIDPSHIPSSDFRIDFFSLPIAILGLGVLLACLTGSIGSTRTMVRTEGMLAGFCLCSAIPALAFIPFYQELPLVTISVSTLICFSAAILLFRITQAFRVTPG